MSATAGLPEAHNQHSSSWQNINTRRCATYAREQATPARERRGNRHVSMSARRQHNRWSVSPPVNPSCKFARAALQQPPKIRRNGSLIVVRISSLPRHWHHLLANPHPSQVSWMLAHLLPLTRTLRHRATAPPRHRPATSPHAPRHRATAHCAPSPSLPPAGNLTTLQPAAQEDLLQV